MARLPFLTSVRRPLELFPFACASAVAVALAANDAHAQAPPVAPTAQPGETTPAPASTPASPASPTAPPAQPGRPTVPATTTFVSLTGPGAPEPQAPVAAPRARPSVVATAPASEPEPQATHDRPTAFRADFKLPVTISTFYETAQSSASTLGVVPQLVIGLQTGRLGLGAGLGFTRFGTSSSVAAGGGLGSASFSGSEQDETEIMIAPTLTYDVFESNDGKVALYLLGAPLFGVLIASNQSAESDVGFQFALGAGYALHDNFRIGFEAGPVGHFYNLDGGSQLSVMSIYTALVGTFAYPR